MDSKYLHLRALKKIIDERVPFQIALEKTLQQYNLSEEDQAFFKMNVMGSLRHFNYLQFEATTAFKEFDVDDDEIYLIILALYELRYHQKDISLDTVIDQVIETIDYFELRLDKEKTKERLINLAKNKTPIPDEYKKDPYSYNSLFFNLPRWLIKLWAEEYGDDSTMNMLLSFTRRNGQFLALNTLKCKVEDFEEDQRFTIPQVIDTALEYRAGPLSDLPEVVEGKLITQDLSNQIMIENLKLIPHMKVLHIGAVSGAIGAQIAVRLQNIGGTVDALYVSERRYGRGKYLSSHLGVTNFTPYFGGYELMKTYSPYGVYDMVILSPKSTHLGQIRRRPDVPLTVSLSSLKKHSKEAIARLLEASNFVCDGGTLVYNVSTINKEETVDVIKKFLVSKPEYELVEDRQIFPYEYGSDGFYYAIMVKR